MTVVNLNKPLMGLENEEVKDQDGKVLLLSKLLATSLMRASSKEPVKLFEMALQLLKDGTLSLDTTDKDTIVKFIKESEDMTVLFKGRILAIIDEAKVSKTESASTPTPAMEVAK